MAATIADRNPDAVGVTCLTAYYHETVALCRALQKYQIPIILGGPHPTFLPKSTLEDTGADFVVCGEGEIALVKLVRRGFRHSRIPGVYALGDLNDNIAPVLADSPENLDDLPFPDWPKMPPAAYPKAPHGAIAKRYPVGLVMTSRGCGGRCSFCAAPALYGRKVRFRSGASVADEIRWQVRHFRVKEIQIEDDNFAVSQDHAEAICAAISALPEKVPWTCPSGLRADCVDERMLRFMKQAGCYMVAFGVESSSNDILARAGKQETIEQMTAAIRLADDAGLITFGYFVFGLPGETEDTIAETIRFASQSKLKRAQFLVLDVLPGSRLWQELSFRPDWRKESFVDPEWVPPGLSAELLRSAQRKAFWKFYSHPARLAGLAARLHPGQFKSVLQRLSSFRLLPG